ncbi:MAG: helix-turn-helix domain-containing protein [Actinobacteria bacterium]|uniref:Unannotated protein n=1 Tax=freshwater metagenome TaxID=449393 RepID=A0A6J6AJ20_9ZZZZ|nr:helix-turn-helix domain-containing protein [Actinomycetota bacterium]
MSTYENTNARAQLIGLALRDVRRARKWTLAEFEIASHGRIKAVVLGSYERGSRSVSVDKLQTIAEIYAVPIGAFFKQSSAENCAKEIPNIIIDLRKLREEPDLHSSKVLSLLDQFCSGIINFRKDWNGEILSLRKSDINLLAIMTATNAENLLQILASNRVLFNFKD